MEKQYQEVDANDLKPGDELVNFGRLKSVFLRNDSVSVIASGDSETILGYNEPMLIEKREEQQLGWRTRTQRTGGYQEKL